MEITKTPKKKKVKVWESLPPPWTIGKDGFTPIKVKKDKEGWADASIYRPFPYDLVQIQVEGRRKNISGWWNGMFWDGYALREGEKVLCWRMFKGEERNW